MSSSSPRQRQEQKAAVDSESTLASPAWIYQAQRRDRLSTANTHTPNFTEKNDSVIIERKAASLSLRLSPLTLIYPELYRCIVTIQAGGLENAPDRFLMTSNIHHIISAGKQMHFRFTRMKSPRQNTLLWFEIAKNKVLKQRSER